MSRNVDEDGYPILRETDSETRLNRRFSDIELGSFRNIFENRRCIFLSIMMMICLIFLITTIIMISIDQNVSMNCKWDTEGNKRIIVFGTFDAFIGDPNDLWNVESYDYRINSTKWNVVSPSLLYNGRDFSTLTISKKGRYSDRMTWIDLISEYMHMTIVSPYSDNVLEMSSTILPFGIEGSFAEGNIFDEDGNTNVGYQRLVSDDSYESQVRNFIRISNGYDNNNEDLYIYSGVGFLDIILLSFETGISAIDFNIENSVRTHIRLIEKLYDAGMRQMFVTIADNDFYKCSPLAKKSFINPMMISYISSKYYNMFNMMLNNYTSLEAFDLDVTIVKYSDIVYKCIQSGISLNTTIYDYSQEKHGVYKRNLIFMDDFIWSEATNRIFFDHFLNPWIRLQIGECNLQIQ